MHCCASSPRTAGGGGQTLFTAVICIITSHIKHSISVGIQSSQRWLRLHYDLESVIRIGLISFDWTNTGVHLSYVSIKKVSMSLQVLLQPLEMHNLSAPKEQMVH